MFRFYLVFFRALDSVTEAAIAHFREAAEKILETREPVDALAAALACISGTTDIVPRSLLTKKEVKNLFFFFRIFICFNRIYLLELYDIYALSHR